jgi:hypothetical protein
MSPARLARGETPLHPLTKERENATSHASGAVGLTSGSERRRRHLRLSIRFSDEELTGLAATARRAGYTLSSYARFILVGTKPLRSARRPPVETELLARALGQLGKIGSNINQIAHVLNRNRDPDPPPSSLAIEISEFLNDLGEARAMLMMALGRKVRDP